MRAAPLLSLQALDTLWLQTGTACNLSCPFCHEGSAPGDTRLPAMDYDHACQAIDAALALGVQRFAFTGGEPLIHRDILRILEYALAHRPALVLTNGTAPLIRRPHHLQRLRATPQPLQFRVSIDYPDEARHDAGRGLRNFRKALQGLALLHQAGFAVGITRRLEPGEDSAGVEARFRTLLARHGLPPDLPLVALPELGPLHATDLPAYACETPPPPLCTGSRTVCMHEGHLAYLPCPLVDDDPRFALPGPLQQACATPVAAAHPRCAQCLTIGVPSFPAPHKGS
ncbi:MAG: radical SAM protein [Steroidobacteraceae bacterium]